MLWYIKTYFTKIGISQLWSFYSFQSCIIATFATPVFVSRCRIRIRYSLLQLHLQLKWALVSSTFRNLSQKCGVPLDGARGSTESLLAPVEVASGITRKHLCPPPHSVHSSLLQPLVRRGHLNLPDQKSH